MARSHARITEVLEMVGLDHRRRDLVRTFSRGMQQRLAIGRAVLHDPDVMLFDEPYTGLAQDASSMLDEVLKTVAARGRTVVMTSHDLARAEDLATRFDILSRGVIGASTSRAELQHSNLLTFYREALANCYDRELRNHRRRDRNAGADICRHPPASHVLQSRLGGRVERPAGRVPLA